MTTVAQSVWEQAFGDFDLQSLGVTDADVQRSLSDPTFAGRLADMLMSYPESESQRTARRLMGDKFLGPNEVWCHFKVRYTDWELQQLATIPFSERTLRECQHSHILVAGYSLSLMDILGKCPPGSLKFHFPHSWYYSELFATRTRVAPRWYLLQILPVMNSHGRLYKDQVALLKEGEEVPSGCELVYGLSLFFLAGRRLYLTNPHSVRCTEETSRRGRFHVAVQYGSGELYDISNVGTGAGNGLALASSRKPEL